MNHPFTQLETSEPGLVRFEASIELPRPDDSHPGHSVVLNIFGRPDEMPERMAEIFVSYEFNGHHEDVAEGKLTDEQFRAITGYVPPPPAPKDIKDELLDALQRAYTHIDGDDTESRECRRIIEAAIAKAEKEGGAA